MIKFRTFTALLAATSICLFSAAAFAEDKAAVDSKAASAPAKAAAKETKAAAKEGKAPVVTPNAPVVIVNGMPLTRAEYNRGLKQYAQKLSNATGGKHSANMNPNDKMKMDVLEDMIKAEVLYQEAKKSEHKDLTDRVNKEFSSLKEKYGDEAKFKEDMKKGDLDEKSFKALIRKSFTVNDYIADNLVPKLKPTEADAKKYFDENPKMFESPAQVRASHILIKSDKKDPEEKKKAAREKADGLLKRVRNGEDFATLAKENSDCPSAKDGGDLDFFYQQEMAKPFGDAAFSMKKGDVSDVVETQFGYHIIKVTDKKDSFMVSFDDWKDQIMNRILETRVRGALDEKVKDLRSKAKVDYVAEHL